jgi:hypothetical protein
MGIDPVGVSARGVDEREKASNKPSARMFINLDPDIGRGFMIL